MAIAVVAEADAGRHADLGLLEQLPGELQRAELAVGRRDGRPDIHAGLRAVDRPAGFNQAFVQHVAAPLVAGGDVLHALLVALQRGDGGDLQRREGAVVVVALDAGQRGDEVGVADHEADAPAGHVVALAEREELHRHVLGARHLHDGRGHITVVDDVGIGQVVHDQDVVLLGQRHHALEEAEVHALRRRVGREAEHHHLGLGVAAADGLLQLDEEVHLARHRNRADVGPGDHRAIDVDGVAGVGHQHRVATVQRGQHQVGQALLGADGDDGLAVGVDRHAVAALVPMRDRAAQPRDALAGRVAVGIGPLRDLVELGDDVRWRGPIGVAHAHVDDVFAAPAGRELELRRDVEDVGWEAVDARETALAARGGGRGHWQCHVSARNRPSDVARRAVGPGSS
mmetsp:Transcript_2839/g.7339  ORF Transcript_2839/g.7339 Transcript_2839/m.7339 type:complete len:399 (+) Transcript_2839:976-2172(+)